MWRYPKTRKSVIFLYFFGCGAVAICGDTPKIKKTVFFEVFFLRLWRCGDMWRYVAIPENKKLCYFLYFWLWRYAAIPKKTQKHIYGAIPENRNMCDFFVFLGCGTVAISGHVAVPENEQTHCLLKMFQERLWQYWKTQK